MPEKLYTSKFDGIDMRWWHWLITFVITVLVFLFLAYEDVNGFVGVLITGTVLIGVACFFSVLVRCQKEQHIDALRKMPYKKLLERYEYYINKEKTSDRDLDEIELIGKIIAERTERKDD